MEKQNNVPKLRFSEFSDGWEVKKLGEVAEFLDGRRKPIKGSDRIKINGIYPYYGASGIIDYVNDFIFDEEIILLGEDGENIISRNLPLAFKVTGKCWVNNHAHVLKPKNSYDIDFVTQSLEIISYVQYNTGTAQPKLNQAVCNSIPISFPTLPEQQKIATFLSTVDEKLQALKKKKSLLETYKKGVMQKLFSQEIRFKDDEGNDFKDWKVKKLGEVGNFIGGGTPSTKNVAFWNGNTPWISSSDLTDDSIYQIRATRFITNDAIIDSATKLIPKKSVLIVSRVGVGKIAINEIELCTSQDFTSLNPYSDNYIFLAYLLKIKTKELLEFNQGTSIKGFVKSDLETLKISLPSLPEQSKIANFLTAIDEKITKVDTQIKQTELWKKGLLQQMFV